MNLNNEMQNAYDLEQSDRLFEIVSINDAEKVYRMTPATPGQINLGGTHTNSMDNSSMTRWGPIRAIITVSKLTEQRPLRHRLPTIETYPQTPYRVNDRPPSTETGPPPSKPGQTPDQVMDGLPSTKKGPLLSKPGQAPELFKDGPPTTKTGPPLTEPGQITKQVKGFTPEFFYVKSVAEAEDRILSVIEKLDTLDQTCTLLFKDILVKYGPQLEKDNPAFIRICLACVKEFLKRDGTDAGVQSVLDNILSLHKQSWSQGEHKKYGKGKQLQVKKSDMNGEQKDFRKASGDSGYGDHDDVILWTSEDSFILELSENLKSCDVQKADLMADVKTKWATWTKESMSVKTSPDLKPTANKSPSLYNKETTWSNRDTVKKTKDSIQGCDNLEFTMPKGCPVSDDGERSGPSRSGLEEVDTKWTSATHINFSRHRPGDWLSRADLDDNWRQPTSCQEIEDLGKLSTIPKEDCIITGVTTTIPPRPPHLIFRDASGEGHPKVVAERHPLGPGDYQSLIAKVEEGLPKGMFSAVWRRATFRKYDHAGFSADDKAPEVGREPVAYSREELLTIANSPLSRRRPAESPYLCKLHPGVCLEKAESYFSTKDYCHRPSAPFFYSKQKRLQFDEDVVSHDLEGKTQEQNQGWRRFCFYSPEQKFEFGHHASFPQTGLWGHLTHTQESAKSVFGSNANFILQDFQSCSASVNKPDLNSDECTTFTFQRI